MRAASLLSVFTFALSIAFFVPGCGGSDNAEVAPRTEDEIAAAEAEIYGAEEEQEQDTLEAEQQ